MIGGTTSTVLQPLRTLADVAGVGGGSGEDNAAGATTTTDASAAAAGTRRTTTTAADGTTTTRRPSRTTTTANSSATTTSLGGGGGTTPPPTSPIGDCRAGALSYSTRTNKGSYRANEQVGIELIVRNASTRPCYAPGPCGDGPWASIEDTEGNVIWKNSPKAVGCTKPEPRPPLLNPSDSHNYGTVGSWNQLVCPAGDGCTGPQAQPGTYRATAHRGAANASGITFALRG